MTDSDSAQAVVMQFAKWPEKGRVKTRLMPALGAVGACNAHITLTLAVLDNLFSAGYPVQFWWDRALEAVPVEANDIVCKLERASIRQYIQTGQTLGDRMLVALSQSLESYGCGLIIGSDCPSVDREYILQAIDALAKCDVVLGPSDDGGYVLIGASRVVVGMLDGIQWGTGQVLEQTRRRLKKLGLNVMLLEPRWDVDEPEDWLRFQRMTSN